MNDTLTEFIQGYLNIQSDIQKQGSLTTIIKLQLNIKTKFVWRRLLTYTTNEHIVHLLGAYCPRML